MLRSVLKADALVTCNWLNDGCTDCRLRLLGLLASSDCCQRAGDNTLSDADVAESISGVALVPRDST